MSAPDNQYETSNKYKGKIKFRNLDPSLQSMIKSASGGNYNDEELRELIKELEYRIKTNANNYSDLKTKIENVAYNTDLDDYRKKDVDITYNDLDSDLKNRLLNNGSSSGGTVDQSTLDLINKEITDLKTQDNVFSNIINTNSTQISNIADSFNSFKATSISNDNKHDNSISQNTERISRLEEQLKNGIDVDINSLSPELQNKINKIDPVINDVSILKQQVDTNTTNISINKNNISTIISDFTEFKTTTNNSIDNNTNNITNHEARIVNLENENKNLTISRIIAKSSNPNNKDAGKIVRDNLSSELLKAIDMASGSSADLSNVVDYVQNPGAHTAGFSGQFVYKEDNVLQTKSMFNTMYIALTSSMVTYFKDELYFPFYDAVTGSIWNYNYESNSDDDGQIPTNGTWEENANGLHDTRYNFTFLFDPKTNILYYNNNGELSSIVNTDNFSEGVSIGDWKFSTNEQGSLILSNNDSSVMIWSLDDNISSNMIFLAEDNTFNEKIIALSKKTSKSISMDKKSLYNAKVLILDTKTTSPTYNLYIQPNGEFTLAYTDNSITMFNNTDEEITIKILY